MQEKKQLPGIPSECPNCKKQDRINVAGYKGAVEVMTICGYCGFRGGPYDPTRVEEKKATTLADAQERSANPEAVVNVLRNVAFHIRQAQAGIDQIGLRLAGIDLESLAAAVIDMGDTISGSMSDTEEDTGVDSVDDG